LVLIIAEAALETVPKKFWSHPAVKNYARKRGKSSTEVLLDRCYHHAILREMRNNLKRGRPDIVHFALLEALGSPLNRVGLLETYVHTINDAVIFVDSKVRVPRNYERFVGLIEQLFKFKRVPPTGKVLLKIEHTNLSQFIKKISPSYVLALSRRGTPKTLEKTISKLCDEKRLSVIIGGFPHGTFTQTTLQLANEVVSIDSETLETWTVVSRLIYEYERCISLPEKRLLKNVEKTYF